MKKCWGFILLVFIMLGVFSGTTVANAAVEPVLESMTLNGKMFRTTSENRAYVRTGDVVEFSFANAAYSTLTVVLMGSDLADIPGGRQTITLDAYGKGQYIMPDNISRVNTQTFCMDVYVNSRHVQDATRYFDSRVFESIKLNGKILPQGDTSGFENSPYVEPGDVLEFSFVNAAYMTINVVLWGADLSDIPGSRQTITLDTNGKGQYIMPKGILETRTQAVIMDVYTDRDPVHEATRNFNVRVASTALQPVFESIKLNGKILPKTELSSGNDVYVKPGDVLEFSFSNAAYKTLKVVLMGSDLGDIPGSGKTITLDANGKGQYIMPENISVVSTQSFIMDIYVDNVYVSEATRYFKKTALEPVFESIKLNGKILPQSNLSNFDNAPYAKPGDVLEFSFANAAYATLKVVLMEANLVDIPGSRKTIILDENGKGQYIMPESISGASTQCFIMDVYVADKGYLEATRYFNIKPAPALPPPVTIRFSDLPSYHWAYDSVMLLVSKGVISGYPDGTFRPNGMVTRSEFAKMMTLALGIPLLSNPVPSFVDLTKNDWEFTYVETAKKYLTGYQQGDSYYFKGKEQAVREDMAVALVKALQLENEQVDVNDLKNIFTDYDSISPNLQRHVLIAYKNKLINGYPDGTFGAKKSITRAETASLLVKVLDSEAMKNRVFN